MTREYSRDTELEEAINSGSVTQVKAKKLALNQHFESKRMGYIVRARLRVGACEGIKAAG